MKEPRSAAEFTLQDRYEFLISQTEKLVSAFAGLATTIEHGCPDVALDMCRMFESYGCGVLDAHPRHREGGEA